METDPTILWTAVGAIIFGFFSIGFVLYRESRYTKEVQKTTGDIQNAVGIGNTTLQENDRVTHEKLDQLGRNANESLRQLDSRAEEGFSEMGKYIAAQQALLQHAQNTKISTAELLSYVKEVANRAAETERFKQERDSLKCHNAELLQLIKSQECSLEDLKQQVNDLSEQLKQRDQIISRYIKDRPQKSQEHDWDPER